jgi:hypothetical protein
MKKIQSKNKQKSMHSHIDLAYKIINAHLPVTYIHLVRELLPEKTSLIVTDSIIRNVRHRRQNPERQMEVFSALLAIAKSNKASGENLAKQLES